MAKIAAETGSVPPRRVLARGAGWEVSDVQCTLGPCDRPFEERHSGVSIAAVVAGTFQYRSSAARELMTPGSLLLGNAGQYYDAGTSTAPAIAAFRFPTRPGFSIASPPTPAPLARASKRCACPRCASCRPCWRELHQW